ncbi:uncharacterized protein VP01_778g2, partial [Puccinia sorghi]
NYGFNLTYRQIPTPGQCIPIFEERLKALSEVQSKLYSKHPMSAMKQKYL